MPFSFFFSLSRAPQYRSAVFFHGEAQAAAVRAKGAALEAAGRGPIVTEVADAAAHTWWPAEEYHQCYVKNNPQQPYVRGVSLPKYYAVKRKFPELFK